MRFRSSEEMKMAEFDLTPMIDVVLLLIIFFMLSSQFARVNAKVLNLPSERGEAIPAAASSHETIVDIDADGVIWMNEKAIADSELDEAIREAGTDAEFVIRADRECMAERLNLVAMTLIRQQVRTWKLAVAGDGGGAGGAVGGGAP